MTLDLALDVQLIKLSYDGNFRENLEKYLDVFSRLRPRASISPQS